MPSLRVICREASIRFAALAASFPLHHFNVDSHFSMTHLTRPPPVVTTEGQATNVRVVLCGTLSPFFSRYDIEGKKRHEYWESTYIERIRNWTGFWRGRRQLSVDNNALLLFPSCASPSVTVVTIRCTTGPGQGVHQGARRPALQNARTSSVFPLKITISRCDAIHVASFHPHFFFRRWKEVPREALAIYGRPLRFKV